VAPLFPARVVTESSQSPSQTSTGASRRGAGVCTSKGGVAQLLCLSGSNRRGVCCTLGRILYIQEYWLCARGAVNAFPDSSSVCSPYGATLGLF